MVHTVQEGLTYLSQYTIQLLEDRDHQSHLIGSTIDGHRANSHK